ncbi:MAG TPA: cysteine desulfurase family protein [Candidatus Paceibacterota bacterium]|jgi:cysteine desulfurase|nr:cysteine desulfurase family protein [Candidatus Paceibacterota bacterium]
MFWKKRIYADAASATPLSARAKKELVRVLSMYGNPGALHQEALSAKKELDRARKTIADAIGAHPDEIVFVASGTEANNLALLGTLAPRLRQGEKLSAVTTTIEHQSVLAPLSSLEREGLAVVLVGVQPDGLVFPNAISHAVRPDTALVSVQLINSEMGAVQPARDIAKEIRRVRTLRHAHDDSPLYFHIDASQAPLWVELKVEKLGIDMMTLDAQKILGPKGIGVLYIKRGTLIDPVIWGGGQEKGKRAGTENAPLAAAFAAALFDAQHKAAKNTKHTAAVRDYLFAEIKKVLPDVVLHGPFDSAQGKPGESRVANNLNISVSGLDGQMAVIAMDAAGIAVSTRSACSTDDEEPSYVIEALGADKKTAKEAIRITLLPDASYSDARRIAQALSEIATRYKK